MSIENTVFKKLITSEYEQVTSEDLAERGEIAIKLINTEDDIFLPVKKHSTDAGYDCRANIDSTIVIEPWSRAKIPLGFGINLPIGTTGDVRPRSGLMSDYGIVPGYGTVDVGYTGEVAATLFNLSDDTFTVNPMDRIAQLVILPTIDSKTYALPVSLKLVDELLELERGQNGHGSTGVQ